MFFKLLSLSKKLQEHVGSCGWKEDCKICPKIKVWVDIFINYEKDNNKELQIEKIVGDEFVEKVFFKDDIMKILN